jgi:pSer/pThr/pTyr-binding forkhead associated (FHA) protein
VLLAAERAGVPFLSWRDGTQRQRLHELDAGAGPVRFGRRPANDVVLDWDGEVSGLHAELECISDEWTIADDGLSKNGTFLNGERVAGRRRLRGGDRLRMGVTVIVFHTGVVVAALPTTVGTTGPTREALSATQQRVLVALCRPGFDNPRAAPAANARIAAEVFLTEDAVKKTLRGLFARYDLKDLEQNQKRSALVELALAHDLVSARDYS